jgi:hypothetical protein
MKKKKPLEIKNMEEVLAKLPEGKRASARAAILEMFQDYDPENPPGKLVLRLSADAVRCPVCGADLVLAYKHTTRMPDRPEMGPDRDQVVEFSECAACEQPFERVAGS